MDKEIILRVNMYYLEAVYLEIMEQFKIHDKYENLRSWVIGIYEVLETNRTDFSKYQHGHKTTIAKKMKDNAILCKPLKLLYNNHDVFIKEMKRTQESWEERLEESKEKIIELCKKDVRQLVIKWFDRCNKCREFDEVIGNTNADMVIIWMIKRIYDLYYARMHTVDKDLGVLCKEFCGMTFVNISQCNIEVLRDVYKKMSKQMNNIKAVIDYNDFKNGKR